MNAGTARLLNERRSAASPIIVTLIDDVRGGQLLQVHQDLGPKVLNLQRLIAALLDKYIGLVVPLEIQAAARARDRADCKRPPTRQTRGGRVLVPMTRPMRLIWEHHRDAFLADLSMVTARCQGRYEEYRRQCDAGTAVPPPDAV